MQMKEKKLNEENDEHGVRKMKMNYRRREI